MTLKQIREQLPEGKWGFSRVYEDVNVAIAIGHAHDFWDLPENVQSLVLARFRVRGTVEAFEDELAKEKSKQRNVNRAQRAPARPGRGARR